MTEQRPTSLVRAAVTGTVIALVLVAIVYAIARGADADLRVTGPGQDTPEAVPIASALIVTALGGVVGWILAFLARRFTPRPNITFLVVCLVLLVLDGITPFTASDKVSTGLWLNAMHLAAAVPIVGSLFRALPSRRSQAAAAALSA
jgi:hypothetical protein